MSRALARLLVDTLRLSPPAERAGLVDRWAGPDVAANADAIAAWSAFEQVEQWLLRRLLDHGALAGAPAKLVTALQSATRRDVKAGMAVDADTADVLRLLAAHGVPCVLLKGPARRASVASLVLADARLTRDVDVLVPAGEAERVWRQLRARGYSPYKYDPGAVPPGETEVQGPSPYHLRTLVREGGSAVELHVTTERGLPPEQAWARLWSSARVVSWQGLDVHVPSGTELLWQALTHADVTRPPGWTLRYWLDAVSVLAAQPVDWATVIARVQPLPPGERTPALRWLSIGIRLAGTAQPAGVAPPVPFALERLLAWRLDVLATARRPRWRQKLLDEATRMEAGLDFAPPVTGRSWPIQVRRRCVELAARGAYRAWRFGQLGGGGRSQS